LSWTRFKSIIYLKDDAQRISGAVVTFDIGTAGGIAMIMLERGEDQFEDWETAKRKIRNQVP